MNPVRYEIKPYAEGFTVNSLLHFRRRAVIVGAENMMSLSNFQEFLKTYLGGSFPVMVIWDARFSVPFIERMFSIGESSFTYYFKPEVIDLKSIYTFLSLSVKDKFPDFKFDTVCRAYGINPTDRLQATIKLFENIKENAEQLLFSGSSYTG